ncbi:MAG TPA: M20/M25/M40 family metallo-hydrolase, partial [Chloroflexota bacterium]|nr:M20/M25/M40 family metallo-hydrolase [Chloroflexota bacterium]
MNVDESRVLDLFLELVKIDSPSGHEQKIAEHLAARLNALGCTSRIDETGNVLGRRPGQGDLTGRPCILLSGHMDTVQPGIGVQPRVEDGIVRSSGTTILGADDKAGLAAILEALRVTQGTACRPVEVAFSVQEETGLSGSKGMDTTWFDARQAVVLDSNNAVGSIVNQAPAADKLRAVVYGKAAHAGVSPELGISAIHAVSKALAKMKLGRIDPETTANVGTINGGTADNIIPDRVELIGGARSRSEAKLNAQIAHMQALLESEAAAMGARAEVTVERSYGAIDVSPTSALIQELAAAIRAIGLEPSLLPTGGGSDANIFNDRGIEAVNLGVGYRDMHSTDESMSVADLVKVTQIVVQVL